MREVDLPRWRGALHAWGFLPFLAAATVLVLHAEGAAFWPTLAYAASLCGLLGTSALYHRVDWSPRWYHRVRRMDHAMIFVLIVGTWTPLCLVACADRDIITIYLSLCVAALVGVAITVAWTGAPKWLRAAVYVAVGWTGLLVAPTLWDAVGPSGVGMLALGGVLYSVGAVFYALKRPNPLPGVFGYHELFHALVLAAAATHMLLVGFWVLP